VTQAPPIENIRDLRRHQIIQVARQIVADTGLDALTIGMIEKRLSYSRGVITYHFQNKEEIVMAVYESAIEEIDSATRAVAQTDQGLQERVRAVIETTIQGFLKHPEASTILVSFWGRIRSDPKVAEINATLYRKYRRYSEELISGTDVDAKAMAALFVAIVIGLVTQVYFEPGAIDVDAAITQAANTLVASLRPTT
jgi:AcrR family transcriptional regulator